MVFILSIFFFTIIIGFLVFIHELGHFLAAKLSGIYVQEFAIGFGPVLFQKEFQGTLYRLNLLPLGGYVSLEGEESTKKQNGFRSKPFLIKFFVLSAGVFMNILVALFLLGISLYQADFNVLVQKFDDFSFTNTKSQNEFLPIFLGSDIVEQSWNELPDGSIIVGSVDKALNPDESISSDEIAPYLFENSNEFESFIVENQGNEVSLITLNLETLAFRFNAITLPELGFSTPAIQFSIAPDSRSADQIEDGEVVVAINGESFDSLDDFLLLLESYDGQTIPFTFVDRQNEYSTYVKDIEVFTEDESGIRLEAGLSTYFGLSFVSGFGADTDRNLAYLIEYENNIASVFAYTWDTTWYQISALGQIFGNAFSSGDFEEVGESTGGVVRVFDTTRELITLGLFDQLITFTALISLSLAIFNILPFPALDGGQIAVYGIEALTRREIPDAWIEKINLSGFLFLMLLFVLVTINDLNQIELFDSIENFLKSVLGR